jgi:hypothetical protein
MKNSDFLAERDRLELNTRTRNCLVHHLLKAVICHTTIVNEQFNIQLCQEITKFIGYDAGECGRGAC